MSWLLDLPIQSAGVLVPVYILAGVLGIMLILPVPGVMARPGRWLPAAAAAAGVGAVGGSVLVWVVVDVQDMFGAPASMVIRGAAAVAGAGICIGILNLVRTRWWRKLIAILALPVFAATGGLLINRDVAYYPKLRDAIGITGVSALPVRGGNTVDKPLSAWRPPAGMPSAGLVGTARIPGTVSHWHPRTAWVYLPPAGRVAHPPKLPVMVAFSGQPGGPSDVFQAGGLAATMDAIARAHHGVAPVVVVPDQLGAYNVNPECVDSKMGDVATYVTVDVREWVLKHLPVSAAPHEWTAAGFSQGGTCAVQFGVTYPSVFGSYLSISPELGPINGTVARSVREAFSGSRAKWEAAQPIAIMMRKRPYRNVAAVYAYGALDTRYGDVPPKLATASRAAGMRTSLKRLPGVAHNWNTGAAGFAWGTRELTSWWGLP